MLESDGAYIGRRNALERPLFASIGNQSADPFKSFLKVGLDALVERAGRVGGFIRRAQVEIFA